MADINEIDLDVEAIRSSVSGVEFSINDNEGNYSGEWLTTGCISSAFQIVNDILTNFASAKGILISHLDELDTISAEAAAKLDMLGDFLSTLPSHRGNTATVSSDISSLCVRTGPGTNNDVVGYAGKGATVTVVGKGDNNGWTEVQLADGTRGYVATKYITFNPESPETTSASTSTVSLPSPEELLGTTGQETSIGTLQPLPSIPGIPTQEEVDARMRAGTASVSDVTLPQEGDTWMTYTDRLLEERQKQQSASDVTLPQEGDTWMTYTDRLLESRRQQETQTPAATGVGTAYVDTKTLGLNVRTGKGTNSPIKTSVAKGTNVTVLNPDDGSGWTYVQLSDGTTGYVSSKYLHLNNDGAQSQTRTTDTSSTISIPASTTGVDTAYVDTKTLGLNVRTGKGTNSPIKTSVAKGSTVTILKPDDGSGWTYVQTPDGTTGYVSSSYLSTKSSNTNTNPSIVDLSNVNLNYVDSTNRTLYSGTAVVNTNTSGLNLRSSAGGYVLTSIPKGTEIEIGESANGWTKVKYNGHEGYVATKWLSDIKNGEE